ncbi:hypothetical protein C8R43DRAFT_955592 [Mycena crocata]|nr:hypothetical protein C8R43DRAFT_955592 [Mycena crocata]
MLPSLEFDGDTDVIAAADKPASQHFFEVWKDMAVICDRHFILVYTILPDGPILPDPLLSLDDVAPGTFFGFDNGNLSHHLLSSGPSQQLSPNRSARTASLSPARSSPYPRSLSSASSRSSSQSAGAITSRTPASVETVVDLCRANVAGYNSGKQSRATYQHGTRSTSFCTLARNFYAMEGILADLHMLDAVLECPFSLPGSDGTVVSVTPAEVLKAHHWSKDTYHNKSSSYSAGKKVAARSWIGAPPDMEVASESAAMYRTYLGIRFAWQAGGPLNPVSGASVEPSKESTDPQEQYAAKLTQADLRKCKILIDQFTSL